MMNRYLLIFIKIVLISVLLSGLMTSCTYTVGRKTYRKEKEMRKYKVPQIIEEHILRPPDLYSGDSVGIVAISSRVYTNRERCDSLVKMIEALGYHAKVAESTFDSTGGWFPAPDHIRAQDFQEMIDNPNIRAIIFFRGGYGAVRVVDYLNLRPLRANPKWIVGFSDITTIHNVMRKLKVESIHGIMPSNFSFDSTEASFQSLKNALSGNLRQYDIPPDEYNQYGRAEAILTGGNLSLITAHTGTDLDLNFADSPYILFIEETDESIYRVDRMMQTLKRSGKLANAKGIIFGYFTNVSREETWGSSIKDLLKEYTKDLDIPVVFNFPAGHQKPNYSLYMGRRILLKVTERGTTILF